MKRFLVSVLSLVLTCTYALSAENSWVRINQLGYLPEFNKVAVFISFDKAKDDTFVVKDSENDRVVFTGKVKITNGERWGLEEALRLDFSTFSDIGTYYVECNEAKSPVFKIDTDIYKGTADFALKYMRQQRCGYNPFLDAECHQHDGYIVDDAEREGETIDVRGGWHDASDYLQYLPTSANATFQMLFAWQQTPDKTIFKDEFDEAGRKGSNGIPDILDEAKWGLDWMIKMNPDSARMYNQIADDRDHSGYRYPNKDLVDYGWGEGMGRPVFPVTGKPQGLIADNMNRSTGVSSSAAKYASAFALGAEIFKELYPEYCKIMSSKAQEAYNWGKAVPGNNQTACTSSPYFYEEDNWVDDMELAAATKYKLTADAHWRTEADYWGQLEEVTPWMELGRARHYQFYPFVNLGHFYLASSADQQISEKYQGYMKQGLECLLERAKKNDDPFLYGVPFIWCSNNLVVAALTHAQLYYQATGDESYLEMEASLRDWLFGCNPWGTSMIVGLPEDGVNPSRVHSSFFVLDSIQPYGGLVDGPIYEYIHSTLRGVEVKKGSELERFQNGVAIYNNDPGDYSSNEPTMDGTASLTFYLSTMEKIGNKLKSK